MTARQASPTEPGLWWRHEGSEAPVLCYAVTQPLGEMGAHAIDRAIWYSTAPCDGVRWTRCVPPDDAEVTALRARVEALETAAQGALGWIGNCPFTPEGGATMVAARKALLNAMQGDKR